MNLMVLQMSKRLVLINKNLIFYFLQNIRIRLNSEHDKYVQDDVINVEEPNVEELNVEEPTEELKEASEEDTLNETADLSGPADSDEPKAPQPDKEAFDQPEVHTHIKIVSQTIVNAHSSD